MKGLSASVISANKPVSVVGGTAAFNMPVEKCCLDSGHQQIPPLEALGHEYAAVRYRDRMPNVPESPPWQLVGAADGTHAQRRARVACGRPRDAGRRSGGDVLDPRSVCGA